MADKVGDEFDGYVTGVTAFGLYIELVEHFVEGLVHVSTMADDYYRFVERAHILRGENNGQGLPARRPGAGPGRQGRHGAAAGRSRAGRDSRRRARVRAQSRAAPQQGGAGARVRPGGREQRQRVPGSSAPARRNAPAASSGEQTCARSRHRHRRPHRPRQERAGARADRHRSRPPEGRAGARHHDRPRLRPPRSTATSASRSSTCRATSGSSRTCSPAPAASTS